MKTELRLTSLNKSKFKNKSEYIYPWLDRDKKSKIFKENIFYHWDNKNKIMQEKNKLVLMIELSRFLNRKAPSLLQVNKEYHFKSIF